MHLLPDIHIPTAVARGLQQHGIDVVAGAEWQDGRYRIAPDMQLLEATFSAGYVLVTDDRSTIPSLLTTWAETGRHHGGVIFVDEKTLLPNDVGGLVRALLALVAQASGYGRQDRAVQLQASGLFRQ